MSVPDTDVVTVRTRLDELFDALRAARATVADQGGDTAKPDMVLDLLEPALDREERRAKPWPAATWHLAHLATEIVEHAVPPPDTGSEAYQSVYQANNQLKAWLSERPPEPESGGTGTGTAAGTGGTGASTGGGGPSYPQNPQELADASASDYNGSAGTRIGFLTAAAGILSSKGFQPISPDLIPPITKVVLDVIDFIDRKLAPADLDTMTGLKQQIAFSLQQSVPTLQAAPVSVPVPAINTARPRRG